MAAAAVEVVCDELLGGLMADVYYCSHCGPVTSPRNLSGIAWCDQCGSALEVKRLRELPANPYEDLKPIVMPGWCTTCGFSAPAGETFCGRPHCISTEEIEQRTKALRAAKDVEVASRVVTHQARKDSPILTRCVGNGSRRVERRELGMM